MSSYPSSHVDILNKDKDGTCNIGGNRSHMGSSESWFKRNFAHITLMKPATPLHFSSGSTMLNIHALVLCHPRQEIPSDPSLLLFRVQGLFISSGAHQQLFSGCRTSCSPSRHFYVSNNKAVEQPSVSSSICRHCVSLCSADGCSIYASCLYQINVRASIKRMNYPYYYQKQL